MPLVIKARKIDPVLRGVASKFTKYEQQIYDIYIKALSQMPRDMDNDLVRRAIREAIEAGNPMDGAFGFQWNNFVGSLDKSIPTLASQLAASANISAQALPKAIQISTSFTATDPRAIAWAQQRAGARILGITKESQKAVAETIARGLKGQLNREEVIDGVTRVVGLDSRQARALGTFYEKNLNALLEEGLTYENAARAAKKLGEKYRDRLIRQRATRIARTESNAAANAGRMLSWAEADLQGFLPVGSEKRWKTSQDERNCPTCRPMHNETVPWEGAFSTGDIMPPVHVNCLCTAVIVPAEAVYEKSLYTKVKKTRKTAWLFAKHGSHNQKTHGGKGGSSSGQGVGYEMSDKHPRAQDSKGRFADVEYYTSSGYSDINNYLRTGAEPELGTKNEIKGYVKSLDTEIGKTSAPRDMVLYRGVTGVEKFDNLKKGDTFKDKGFVSTTTKREAVTDFMSNASGGRFDSRPVEKGVVLEISVPKGGNVLSVQNYFKDVSGRYGPEEGILSEAEHLLPRGLTFRVDSISTIKVRDFTEDKLIKVSVVEG